MLSIFDKNSLIEFLILILSAQLPTDHNMTESFKSTDFEPHEFRRALGNFATGVTVITAQGVTEQHPDGAIVRTLRSIS